MLSLNKSTPFGANLLVKAPEQTRATTEFCETKYFLRVNMDD